MAVWGFTLPLVKWLTGHFDVVLLSGLRLTAGVVVLACQLRPTVPLFQLGKDFRPRLLLCAVLTVYLQQLLLTIGIHLSTATNGALITALQPLLSSFMALTFLGERINHQRWLGTVVGLGGVAVTILMQPSAQLLQAGAGDILIFAAVAAYCIGNALTQRLLVQLDALTVSVSVQAFGAMLLLAHALIAVCWQQDLPRMSDVGWHWGVVFISGALSTGFGALVWNRAVAAVGIARASMWLYWVPVFGIASSVLFLGEPLTVWHVIGLLLVLTGTYPAAQRS
ncbi:hypothetical protein LMG24238_07698 [Paraburkholderia sediminicola]|uniref:EamA domain-containing protein n=1 Tax=Paraburkholderia sediminicola TaxID=458836 RepID=A0A6J5CUJ3_9BURK|nr:DMT family transporter [Paraburkholderia sediminicola]CAB3745572.1 hypothetical protein LMG24238_07698 [Paraburkholderia sediminicola]